MPAIIPVAAAAAVGPVTGLVGFWLTVAQVAVAAVFARLVAPRGGFNAEQRANQVVLRSAVEAQRIVYGEDVVSGPLVYSRVSHDIALGRERHRVPVGAPFTVTVNFAAEYSSTLEVSVMTSTVESDGAFGEAREVLSATGGAPGANEYSVSAGVFTFHSSRAGQDLEILYYHGGDEQQASWLHLVIPLAYHQVEEIGDIYFNSDVITAAMLDGDGVVVSGKYAWHARIRKQLGAPGQTADSYLISVSNGQWTSAHVGEGVAYIIVSLRRNQNIYSGVPNIRAKVKGALLYDPRDLSTAWSNNWALVVRDYLTRAEGLGCAAAEIDDDLVSAAANVADEDVDLDAVPTTQKRYTADGVVNLDARPLDVLKELLSAGAGAAVYSVSTWDLYAGAYVAPTRTITVSDLRAPIAGAPDLPRRDIFNAVRGTVVNPDADWQLTSFPPIENSTYQTEDGGEQIFRDIELPFTMDMIRAQRIAKIVLERGRQGATMTWPGKLTCFRLNTWETVNVQVAQLGYTPKVFRVNGWQWQPGGGVDLALQEEAAGAYDWNFGEQTEHDLAPNTTLAAVGPLPPPGAPEVTEELYETRDGRGVAARALLEWVAALDAYVSHYEPEYKLAADAFWTRLPATGDTEAKVDDIAPGIYDFRVRALDSIGRTSGYSQTRKEIVGLAAAPATPTGLSIQVAGGTAILTFDQHPELDVLRGGRIMVRHTEATTSQSWEESLSIGNQESYPGDSVVLFLPLKPGSYLVKARDSTGQESASFATAVTKQASVLTFAQLATPLQEDDTYTGTHDDTVVTSGALLLDTSGGAVLPSGVYTFAAGFDFTTVSRARITGQIESVVFNIADLIDSRTDPIDSWPSIDGDVGTGSLGDAWIEARETDDDPAGTPTWSEWKRVDSAEFECRAMEFRLQMRSFDPTYNIQIDVLRVKAEEVL